jgi:hypothetical protein
MGGTARAAASVDDDDEELMALCVQQRLGNHSDDGDRRGRGVMVVGQR